MLSEERAKWRAIGSAPIRADAPSGESVRYDPGFERLQGEMQKLESLSGGTVDWPQVVRLSREILEDRSKDLLVGSYLVLGLLGTEGLPGLPCGLACLEGLVSDHWPNLFPESKRMRARIAALNWLSEKAGAAVARAEPGRDDGETLTSCGEQVRVIETLLEGKTDLEEPVLADLDRAIRERLSRLPQGRSEPGGPVVRQRPEAEPVPAATAPAAKIEDPEEARRAMKDSFGTLKRVISFARSRDPANPLPYRLIRSLSWCEIDDLPAADHKRSRIPPPPNQLRSRFQTLTEQCAWKELVNQAESRIAEFPLWLDLHRLSETALARLGDDHAKARHAVVSELATLLERLPDLIDFEFSDGTPFADDSTRKWVPARVLPGSVTAATAHQQAEEAPVPGPGVSLLDELRRESRKLLQQGQLQPAVRLVQEATRAAATERERFLVQLELVHLCVEANELQPALAQLERLDRQISRFSLDAWEPPLACHVLRLYWDTLNRALRQTRQPAPELSRRADTVYKRLCTLDVLAVLDVGSAGRGPAPSDGFAGPAVR